MLANVPVNYKQIGTQIFGNEFIIEKLREDNVELNDLVKFQEKQIKRLHHEIESLKKDEDKNVKENHYTHVEKTLLTENGKKFSVGDEIAFRKINKITDHIDRYTGIIVDLRDDYMYLDKIKVEQIGAGALCIKYSDIIPDSFNYAYNE